LDIGRDLRVDRELTACSATVGRNANCPDAVLIGGELSVGGTAEFAQIGSESGTPTTIHLGKFDSLDRLIKQGMELLGTARAKRAAATERLEQLQQNGGRVTSSIAEEVTELQFELASWNDRVATLTEVLTKAAGTVEQHRDGGLLVHQRILPGVTIYAGNRVAVVLEPLPGPLDIRLDDQGAMVFRDGEGVEISVDDQVRFDVDREALTLEDWAGLASAA
ncbi:MAG: FapA family protein, partial [Planctomycetota bacterium]